MRNSEIDQAIELINTSWGGRPLASGAAAMWGAQLRRYAFDDVMRVLTSMLQRERWRPSLASILEALRSGPAVPSAHEAFERVWGQIGRRPRKVTVLEQQVVERLGGWGVLGRWKLDDRHWHARGFAETYDRLVESTPPARLQELVAADRLTLPPRSHQEPPGEPIAPERVEQLTRSLRRSTAPQRLHNLARQERYRAVGGVAVRRQWGALALQVLAERAEGMDPGACDVLDEVARRVREHRA